MKHSCGKQRIMLCGCRYDIKSHTIIEAHPDVYQHMLDLGWDKKPNVKILFGRWEDVLDQLEQYDGIFLCVPQHACRCQRRQLEPEP